MLTFGSTLPLATPTALAAAKATRILLAAECPLLAQSGHSLVHRTCPLSGVKRTSDLIGIRGAGDQGKTVVTLTVLLSVEQEENMATQQKWQLSGDYFENCNCNVVCPCLVSPSAPLTARPSQGVCDVALVFHIDKGSYGEVSLDGLNVAVVGHTPGAMGEGNWTLAAYIDERADDQQTAALGAIFSGAEGGPMAAFAPLVGKHLGVKKVAIKYAITGKSRSAEIPGIMHMAVEPLPSMHSSGEIWACDRSSGRAGQARARCGQQRQHLRRPRHALGQFRQERPLRADQLVELTARAALLSFARLAIWRREEPLRWTAPRPTRSRFNATSS